MAYEKYQLYEVPSGHQWVNSTKGHERPWLSLVSLGTRVYSIYYYLENGTVDPHTMNYEPITVGMHGTQDRKQRIQIAMVFNHDETK